MSSLNQDSATAPDRPSMRGSRLVGDDHLGLGGQRAGQANALPLADGDTRGERSTALRGRPTSPSSSSPSAAPCGLFGGGADALDRQRLPDDAPTRIRWSSELYGSWNMSAGRTLRCRSWCPSAGEMSYPQGGVTCRRRSPRARSSGRSWSAAAGIANRPNVFPRREPRRGRRRLLHRAIDLCRIRGHGIP